MGVSESYLANAFSFNKMEFEAQIEHHQICPHKNPCANEAEKCLSEWSACTALGCCRQNAVATLLPEGVILGIWYFSFGVISLSCWKTKVPGMASTLNRKFQF